MEKDNKFLFHNEFDFIIRDSRTGDIKRTAKAYNIILDGFWTALFTDTADVLDYIHFGTGIATPVASDVKLGTWLGYKTTTVLEKDFSTYMTDGVIKARRSIRLNDSSRYRHRLGRSIPINAVNINCADVHLWTVTHSKFGYDTSATR